MVSGFNSLFPLSLDRTSFAYLIKLHMLSGSQLKEQQVPDKRHCASVSPFHHPPLYPPHHPAAISVPKITSPVCLTSAFSPWPDDWSLVQLQLGIDVDITIWQLPSLGRKQKGCRGWELSAGEDVNHDSEVQLQFPALSEDLRRIPLCLWGMCCMKPACSHC